MKIGKTDHANPNDSNIREISLGRKYYCIITEDFRIILMTDINDRLS